MRRGFFRCSVFDLVLKVLFFIVIYLEYNKKQHSIQKNCLNIQNISESYQYLLLGTGSGCIERGTRPHETRLLLRPVLVPQDDIGNINS